MADTNTDPKGELTQAQAQAVAENAATGVLKNEVTDFSIQMVARAKARFNVYVKIHENFLKYIEDQALQLANGIFKDSPYKELGVARMISIWLTESDAVFKEVQPVLQDSEKTLREGYLEKSFNQLPPEIRDMILKEFKTKKQELLVWLVQRVQEALKISNGEIIQL